jgi:hypothetical protein
MAFTRLAFVIQGAFLALLASAWLRGRGLEGLLQGRAATRPHKDPACAARPADLWSPPPAHLSPEAKQLLAALEAAVRHGLGHARTT